MPDPDGFYTKVIFCYVVIKTRSFRKSTHFLRKLATPIFLRNDSWNCFDLREFVWTPGQRKGDCKELVIDETIDFIAFQSVHHGSRHIKKDVHAPQPFEPCVGESGGYQDRRRIFLME